MWCVGVTDLHDLITSDMMNTVVSNSELNIQLCDVLDF